MYYIQLYLETQGFSFLFSDAVNKWTRDTMVADINLNFSIKLCLDSWMVAKKKICYTNNYNTPPKK